MPEPVARRRGVALAPSARRTAEAAPTPRRHRGLVVRRSLTGWGLLAPSLVGIVVFLAVPIGVVVWLSTQKWNLITPPSFVGAANWGAILADPAFQTSVVVTLLFVIMVIPVQTALGLLVAVLLTRRLPGSAVFRVIFLIPWACAPLALGIVWQWIFAPTGGALNALLGTNVPWLTEPAIALPAVALVTVWSQVGYIALFFTAGIAGIPEQIIDAARVDGAGEARIFFSVTLPLLRPTMFFVLVTSVISTFQVFDSVFALTGGGPQNTTDVIAYELYQRAFVDFDMGKAAVIAVVLFVVLAALTVAQHLWFRRKITYDLS
ncbi:MAG TPA: sugar ABC transporter permease [Microbacteriaceae bacterium]|nr:sugar ABC transporter permease [Microbacteriaceae bacterium]